MVRSIAVLFLLLFCATDGHAHAVGVSRGEYRAEGASVRADLFFARMELVAAQSSAEIGALSTWLRRGIVVTTPAGPCEGDGAATPTEQDGVELTAVYRCAGPVAAFSVRLPLLADLSLGHRHLVTATSGSETVHGVLFAAAPELHVAGTGEAGSIVPALFRLGVEHILTGYDHLLFLIAVVLVGGSLRAILAAVTAFTVAHSVTLGLAALGVWAPRPALVEPAIALSIAYVGIENCLVRDIGRRWRLTFVFGLVHGFGFAGALREIAVSAAELPAALASFNVGVEAGQLAVLAIVLPCTAWLARRRWFAAGGLQAASVGISAIGLGWFVVRVTAG